ncbi:translation initiation inhibitor [Mycolicibacterium murale]|uniref:Translation initiation inhibitor n=1 Tax=Mycolicibacterium murale TaxID=182220 RepID=A0A7I9WLX6_9MYCO|nr:RidA family protein [Mycolicibacterium murale]MCV7180396.1 RidA family protein [Mycolicibacterium murale]GFG58735.1 translation initiation inhibitor [Mycolicibacterium murale]
MNTRPHLKTKKLGQPIGLFSHGFVSTNTQRTLYVAGQLPVAGDGSSVGVGDFDAQFRQVFANFGAVLEAGGFTFDNVVKFTTYLIDPANNSDFYRVRAEVFPTLFTAAEPPPNTLLTIQRLVQPEFLLEVEGIAVISEETSVVMGAAQ